MRMERIAGLPLRSKGGTTPTGNRLKWPGIVLKLYFNVSTHILPFSFYLLLSFIFFGKWNKDDKNDSVEARQNLDGSGEGQDELQRSGTTLICREDSNGERIGREIIREYKV